ncbi:YhcH/YjgK/YiaL family protein [Aerococcaceae bacterium NML160702]|nr:YhcH/YjgK/YiaL family protein [Aerococcaceae bacterium NML160702]
MIYGNLQRLGASYEYPQKLYELLTYLQQQDFNQIPFGSVNLDDSGTVLNYMPIDPANIDEALSEIHRKYLDIQVSIDGNEIFGFASNTHDNPIVEDRLDSDDICLFSKMKHEVRIEAQPLDFFIFFPNDVHHGCYTQSHGQGRRVVVKVPIELL